MARSIKKGPYVAHHLQDKLDRLNKDDKKGTLQTWSRSSTITPDMLGHTIKIHNGRKFIPLFIDENCIGYKLGEFAPTRTYKGHTNKNKKK